MRTIWPGFGKGFTQESGVRSQESGVRSQESGVRRSDSDSGFGIRCDNRALLEEVSKLLVAYANAIESIRSATFGTPDF
jgi:hypothetical protein